MSENMEFTLQELKQQAMENDETFLEMFYELAEVGDPFEKVTLNRWELQTILEMKDETLKALIETFRALVEAKTKRKSEVDD